MARRAALQGPGYAGGRQAGAPCMVPLLGTSRRGPGYAGGRQGCRRASALHEMERAGRPGGLRPGRVVGAALATTRAGRPDRMATHGALCAIRSSRAGQRGRRGCACER